jgi:hypothetical protein
MDKFPPTPGKTAAAAIPVLPARMMRVRLVFENTRSNDMFVSILELRRSIVTSMFFEAILEAWGAHPLASDLRFIGAFTMIEPFSLVVDYKCLTIYTTHVQHRADDRGRKDAAPAVAAAS